MLLSLKSPQLGRPFRGKDTEGLRDDSQGEEERGAGQAPALALCISGKGPLRRGVPGALVGMQTCSCRCSVLG